MRGGDYLTVTDGCDQLLAPEEFQDCFLQVIGARFLDLGDAGRAKEIRMLMPRAAETEALSRHAQSSPAYPVCSSSSRRAVASASTPRSMPPATSSKLVPPTPWRYCSKHS